MAGDAWYESEESTRLGMVAEAQRIRRRTLVRPIPVLLLAATLTSIITYKLATRHPPVEAEVVLALTEGSLSRKANGVPVIELREFVANVLLPDKKLLDLVTKYDLYRLRSKLGDHYAIEEFRSQIDIKIWKNTFIDAEADQEHSARIGITVSDADPDRAFDLARDLASTLIQTAQDQRQTITNRLTADVTDMRDRLRARSEQLAHDSAEKEAAQRAAKSTGKDKLAQALNLELAVAWHEQRKIAASLAELAASRDSLADQITEAGLDMTVTVVEEHRPRTADHHGFVLAMIVVIVAVGSLLGSALLLGAFDARVHDVDDVERLGIPVLGHLPGFPGDDVGSLQSRGAARGRVPSWERLRWDSRR